MSRGVVKFYNGRARYGFIVPEDGSMNVHFAEEALPRDRRYDPQEGDVVEYRSRMGSKGLMAVRIVLDPEDNSERDWRSEKTVLTTNLRNGGPK